MVSHYLNSFLLGVLFVDLLERRFPQQFRSILTEITYNSIYYYSKCQIYFTKMQKQFNTFLNSNKIIENDKFETVTAFKINGECRSISFSTKSKINLREDLMYGNCQETTPDVLLYWWTNEDDKCRNVKLIYSLNEGLDKPEASNIKFILVEFKIGEKTYKIDLKTDDYNYYFVGNKFTKNFFIYYIKTNFNTDLINENEKCVLKIIDHNINMIQVDFTDKDESIILEKNGYKISVTNHSDDQ